MKGRPIVPAEVLTFEKGKLYGVQAEREKRTPKAQKPLKPVCPRSFTKEQRKVWNKYAKVLKNYNMFTAANQTILEILCFNKAVYDYHRDIIGGGDVLKSDGSGFSYEDSFKVMQKVEKVIFKCLQELGLSSAGLAKIGSLAASAVKKQDKIEGILD